MAGAAGDALVAIALADSVFFSIPVGQAKGRVALYLALTMAPLAVAAPALVPLLDRGGYRRAISFAAAAGRALLAVYAAPRASTLVLFPAAFGLLVLSRVHAITKNGLTVSYAPRHEGLVRANGRLGRIAVAGGVLAAGPGLALALVAGAWAVLYLAALAYVGSALLALRLASPGERARSGTGVEAGKGPSMTPPAVGAATLRAASGFLLFLLAFALRRSGEPASWYVILGGAALLGGLLADIIAPRLPAAVREEALVVAGLVAAGAAAFLAFRFFTLPVLALFAAVAGMATELGRLAFQSLMQRWAPGGSQGRVFVRYEILFQLAWVAGALVAAVLPVSIGSTTVLPLSFRGGVFALALVYLGLGLGGALTHPGHSRDGSRPA